MRIFKRTLLLIALLLIVAAGYYTYSFYQFANNISHKAETPKGGGTTIAQSIKDKGDKYTPPKWEGKQRVNILLLGGDSRGMKKNELPRSDSIMLASIDPVTKKAHLFSILRDTYVKIPGEGEDRINTAITSGGPNLAMKTVSDLLGIPVQYYVYTDFKGFIALIDAVGGIDIDVEKDMKYTDSEDDHVYDINLKKGQQHLDGKTALQYVRFRHDALSDFTRTERQRKFLTAVVQKMQTTSSLIKMPKILNAMDPYIDTNLSVNDMVKLATLGYESKAEGIISSQLPPSELLIEKNVRGADVITANKDKLQQHVKDLFAGKADADSGPTKPSPSPTPKSSVKTTTVK
ncbi:transcriptional regulator [Paenibacillus marchantiophytorum]|uniref:Transcriptional regulator n=1 Tax=Paenibacillus marchantiophytorum TaxID=1619310 RepID=A0ABQ1F070_9BACL|nr:LCP family protein [Paenibacillus marchantiophytorum]GFZ95710.1 transcriptional regulator [Paenibacillus marchantiophytorum]